MKVKAAMWSFGFPMPLNPQTKRGFYITGRMIDPSDQGNWARELYIEAKVFSELPLSTSTSKSKSKWSFRTTAFLNPEDSDSPEMKSGSSS